MRLRLGPIAIHVAVKPLQGAGTKSHYDGAEGKQSDAAFKRKLLEDWIRVPGEISARLAGCVKQYDKPSIIREATFDPEPISKGNGAGQAEGG